MAHIVDRAIGLWFSAPADGADGLAAFRSVYADPLQVNGVPTPVQVLVDRAAMLRRAFDGLHHELLEQVDSPTGTAFAFRLSGRHIGPLTTPLGDLPATGEVLTVLGLDLFVLADSRVTGVWAVADWLGLLIQAGRVALVP
jgi:predicted ester cyclase